MKKVFINFIVLFFVFQLQLAIPGEVFAQTFGCESSGVACPAGTSCDAVNDVCVSDEPELPEGPTLNNPTPTPYTGGSLPSGVGTIGNLPGAPGGCGGDPNLIWDANAQICLPKNQQCAEGSLACAKSLSGLLLTVINYLLIFSGIIAVLFIIIGGFWYITAAGNEEQSEKGKKALMNAIIGIVVVSLAFLIVRIVSNTLNTPNILN